MPHGTRTLAAALTAGAMIIVLSSCGASNPSVEFSSSSSTTPSHASGPAYEVTTAQVGNLGPVLVNGHGFTLYLYIPDGHSGHSTCRSICALEWPPLLLPSTVATAPSGGQARSSLLGVTSRGGGSRQVTYGGWPLYQWTQDTSPGEATGQGLNNVGGQWYVVSPSGHPIQ